ncbi:hypothetical protein D9M72_619930 [compost metagenome]
MYGFRSDPLPDALLRRIAIIRTFRRWLIRTRQLGLHTLQQESRVALQMQGPKYGRRLSIVVDSDLCEMDVLRVAPQIERIP